jgi:stearoyl-CoA desaturase (delta-9 desaturase)
MKLMHSKGIVMFDISLTQAIFIALGLTHVTIITVTVFLHRSQTHRALDLHASLNHFFRFWQWLTTGMITKEWVAVHRKHHAFVEKEGDPHSPHVYGIHRILWLGVFQYVKACATENICEKYGRGTPDDWLENYVYSKFQSGGVILMLLINTTAFGWMGLLIWAIQMLWIPFLAAGVINGLGHWWGYRNYHSPDRSTNISPWGILIGGEELHNNHHAYPTSAKLSSKWFEFDLGYMYIRIFEFFGLAKVLRKMPSLDIIGHIGDLEKRVAYIKKSRMLLMAKYKDQVCRPVISVYSQLLPSQDAGQLNELKRYLMGISTDVRASVSDSIHQYDMLNEIKVFSERLDALLKEKCQSASSTLQRLNTLCEEAKQSKVRFLQEYSTWFQVNCLSGLSYSGSESI